TKRAMCGQLSFCSRRSHTPRPIPAQDGPRPPSGGCRYQAQPGNGCGAPDAPLPLALLVPRVGADDQDAAMPANDPAFPADLLNARLDLHPGLLLGPAHARPFLASILSRSGSG